MEKPSTARIAMKWGIISGLLSIFLFILMYNTSLWKYTWLSGIIGLGLTIVILYLTLNDFKKQNSGFMTLGEGFGLGMLAVAVSAVISTLFQLVYVKFIDTSFYEKQANMLEEQYLEKGLPEEQIEMMLDQMEKFNNSGLTFVFGIFAALIFGAIISIILAAILKKNPPVFE